MPRNFAIRSRCDGDSTCVRKIFQTRDFAGEPRFPALQTNSPRRKRISLRRESVAIDSRKQGSFPAMRKPLALAAAYTIGDADRNAIVAPRKIVGAKRCGAAAQGIWTAGRAAPKELTKCASPVHGAFREAVLGPPFTAGFGGESRISRAPFTGLLACRALATLPSPRRLKPNQREAP